MLLLPSSWSRFAEDKATAEMLPRTGMIGYVQFDNIGDRQVVGTD
ncbi:hypothetical protein [Pseudarthrobacter sp. LT1]|nr:hypothetical protein [Pseudarthrobacter sp. LT1]WRT15619.1 hypothetical protein VIK36_09150 [Pseudarthrobacter sp. LT1]